MECSFNIADKTKPNGQNRCKFVGRIVKLKSQMKTSLTNVYGCQRQQLNNCTIYFTFPVIIKKNIVHYKEELFTEEITDGFKTAISQSNR